jgi:iron complex outermembrane recepter protein
MMNKHIYLICAGALTTVPCSVYAQDSGAESARLEEVVVTAQRREERLQDVPIAITALSGADLSKSGALRSNDLGQVVPSLFIQKSGQAVTPFLRGVGNGSANPGNDPSVATYIDGVYQSAPNGLLFSFDNIERVEVLKGPQGTLFGRNATGGLINIVTRDPVPGLSGKVGGGYGSFNTVDGKFYLSGGTETLAGSLSLLYVKQSDGWGRNIATPAEAGAQSVNGVPTEVPPPSSSEAGTLEETGASAKIKFVPGDNTTIRLAGRYVYSNTDQGAYRRGIPGAVLSADGVMPYVFTAGFWDEASDMGYVARSRQWAVSADVDQNMGFATLKSITSYLDFRGNGVVASDSTPQISQTTVPKSIFTTSTFTQELQLLSNPGPVDWIVGLFYLDSTSNNEPTSFSRGALEPSFDLFGVQKSKSKAAFAQIGFDDIRDSKLTLGARYTKDDFSASEYKIGTRTSTIPTPPAVFQSGVISAQVPEQTTSSNAVTWRISQDHRFSPEVLAYISYSRGYKAGGFNVGGMCLTSPAPPGPCSRIASPVDAEFLKDIEVGLKTDLFDQRLRLNFAAFHYDYSNIQVQVVTGSPPVFTLTNAASARIYGAEIDGKAAIGNQLDMTFGLSVLNTKYQDFKNAPIFVSRTVAPYNSASVIAPDLSGNELNRAPKFTANLGANYTLVSPIGTFVLSGNYYHSNGFYWEPSNRLKQQPYDILGAQIEFALPKTDTRFRVWGRNLSNEKYFTYVTTGTSGDQGSVAAPRTYGIAIEQSF